MSQEHHKAALSWLLISMLTIYGGGYLALRIAGTATVFQYGTGDCELWSNIDRMPMIGPALQTAYLPLIRVECALRHLEWSP